MSDLLDRRLHAEDLLAERSLEGLDDQASHQLTGLLDEFPDLDPDQFEITAAQLHLALLAESGVESMPAHLASKVKASVPAATQGDSASTEPPAPLTLTPARPSSTAWVAWLVAAASLLWIALPSLLPERSLDQRRIDLVASATDLVQVPWEATDHPAAAGLTGNAIWSTGAQEGYMTFEGMRVNDPTVEQYQLWIWDESQSEATPIDGGVFDVDSGRAIVPIDAKLIAAGVTMFGVTIEKPGGVVVSDRSQVVALGKVVR